MTVTCSQPGKFIAKAHADSENIIQEDDELNNEAIVYFNVIQEDYDLIISDFHIDPATPNSEDTVTYTTVVENIGVVDAPASDLFIDIGWEPPITREPFLYCEVSKLGPGEKTVITRKLTCDAPPCNGYIATADVTTGDEVNKDNNRSSLTFNVTGALTNNWKFNESSGSVLYDSVGDCNGILKNATTESLGNVLGAVHITGSDSSYVDLTKNVGQFGINSFTVGFWIKTTETNFISDLMGNRTTDNDGNFFCFRMSGIGVPSLPEGTVTAEIDQADGKNHIWLASNVSGLNNGKWHHVAAVRYYNWFTLFVDGKVAARYTQPDGGVCNINNENLFKIGRSLVNPNIPKLTPDALFADVRVYNHTALTDAEIANYYTKYYEIFR
jgi:hypothetical protein